ncbi:aldo/keto reductase [Pseudalkalibacillus berkeleyi]|uniref:Aldo/keto reductase n=1 Tax=Pseudalkalibacillus berkeleyi TaxID=1069813 RepID=A0ABS9GYA3_9BACL|nr:aldo/keto reductase [Pseudalkalibacillus berkeleyi]MCF6137664.1 aldo/keto reductase [Pseudalkalibacillus berkeleyi]
MQRNKLGSSELYVSEIGLGCMSLGKDENESINIIHKALDEGVTFIDTADLYGFGENEEIVGKALKGKRDQAVLATKVGNRWDHVNEGWEWAPSKDYITTAVKKSLHRLGTDYLDLYQLHGGTLDDPIDEIIEAFESLKQEGLIREYGISSIRPNVIEEYLKRSNIVSIMMQYSMLDRRPEELLDEIHENNVSVIARGPLAKGNLTDRIFTDKASEKGFMDYSASEIHDLMRKVDEVSNGRELSHMSLRYPLDHPAVATVIPGASTVSQLENNVKASHIQLSPNEINLMKQWSKMNYYDQHRS